MKKKVILTSDEHKQLPIVKIEFDYSFSIKEKIKSLGCRWSRTKGCWYVHHRGETINKLILDLQKFSVVDYSQLDQKLITKIQTHHPVKSNLNLSEKKKVKEFTSYLRGKRFSESTISTYSYLIAEFLLKTDLSIEINIKTIEKFIENVYIPNKISVSTQRQFVSAMKHYLTFTGSELEFDYQTIAPKRDKKLPNVLSKSEIIRLIQVTKNLKHRICITLLYSSGLRIGELLNLKIRDLDFERSMIKVIQSKGRKDRYVPMSESIKPMLFNYINTYSPIYYLIEGLKSQKKYSQESVRKFLFQNCQLAKIQKKVTPHTLRHSYATHLLESGVDIRYIQSLLGHSKPETTMIYTHVQSEEIKKINNPLDLIVEQFRNNKQKSYLSE